MPQKARILVLFCLFSTLCLASTTAAFQHRDVISTFPDLHTICVNIPPTGTGAAHERRVGTGRVTPTLEGKLELGRQRHGSTNAWPRLRAVKAEPL